MAKTPIHRHIPETSWDWHIYLQIHHPHVEIQSGSRCFHRIHFDPQERSDEVAWRSDLRLLRCVSAIQFRPDLDGLRVEDPMGQVRLVRQIAGFFRSRPEWATHWYTVSRFLGLALNGGSVQARPSKCEVWIDEHLEMTASSQLS